ncbi:hypothetical protein H4N49_14410 [Streptomyces sp. DHE17-7]|nr:hypothetical protein [Streptomyces sp. DHE17-7]MBJ6619930.1 hypothetical protein [Streptomyces sp. DHE17-7]
MPPHHELSKIYGQGETQVVALDRVSVDFRQAEFTAIMGPPLRQSTVSTGASPG